MFFIVQHRKRTFHCRTFSLHLIMKKCPTVVIQMKIFPLTSFSCNYTFLSLLRERENIVTRQLSCINLPPGNDERRQKSPQRMEKLFWVAAQKWRN
jgi:hypothetical protein